MIDAIVCSMYGGLILGMVRFRLPSTMPLTSSSGVVSVKSNSVMRSRMYCKSRQEYERRKECVPLTFDGLLVHRKNIINDVLQYRIFMDIFFLLDVLKVKAETDHGFFETPETLVRLKKQKKNAIMSECSIIAKSYTHRQTLVFDCLNYMSDLDIASPTVDDLGNPTFVL